MPLTLSKDGEDTLSEPSAKKAKTSDNSAQNSPLEASPVLKPHRRRSNRNIRRETQVDRERRPSRPVQCRLVQRIVLEDGKLVEEKDVEAARNFYSLRG
jgi:hypothetical protein